MASRRRFRELGWFTLSPSLCSRPTILFVIAGMSSFLKMTPGTEFLLELLRSGDDRWLPRVWLISHPRVPRKKGRTEKSVRPWRRRKRGSSRVRRSLAWSSGDAVRTNPLCIVFDHGRLKQTRRDEPRIRHRPQTACGRCRPWEPTALHDSSGIRVPLGRQRDGHAIPKARAVPHRFSGGAGFG